MPSLATVEEQMTLVRMLESSLQRLCDEGALAADLHMNMGQEAVSAGVIAALRPTDYVVAHHRTIAHAVAKGVPLGPLVAELFGRANGLCGGMAGEMHLSHLPSRFMFSFQLVGTCLPVAAGLAWAAKYFTKSDDIVAVFHGDAATANGQWHEGVNLAAVQRLPLLMICENNRLAGNVRPDDYQPVPFILDRARGYGIETAYVDGNDVKEVMRAAEGAVSYVREYSRPFLLECDTTRLGKHKQGQGDIRPRDEVERLRARDPLRNVVIDPERASALWAMVDAAIRDAMDGPVAAMPKEA